MATLQTIKASSAATLAMPGVGDGQSAKQIASNYVWTTAPALNDVIVSPMIQAGSVIVGVRVSHTGLGASGTFSVGVAGAADYFTASSSQASAGVTTASNGSSFRPYVMPANGTINVTITAAGASATGTMSMFVEFLPLNA